MPDESYTTERERTIEKEGVKEKWRDILKEMIESMKTNSPAVKAFTVLEEADEDVREVMLEPLTGEISTSKALFNHPDILLYQSLSEKLRRVERYLSRL